MGDVQRAEVIVDAPEQSTEIVFVYDEGTEVYVMPDMLKPAQSNEGLRILRSRADAKSLRLIVEGLGGRAYTLSARTPRRLGEVSGVKISSAAGLDQQLLITFDGPREQYVRREIVIPLLAR